MLVAIEISRVLLVQAKLTEKVKSLTDPRIKTVKFSIPRGHWGGVPAVAVQYDWPFRALTSLGGGRPHTGLIDHQHVFYLTFDVDESDEQEAAAQLMRIGIGFTNAIEKDPGLGDANVGLYEISDTGPPLSLDQQQGKPILRKTIRYMAEMEDTGE